MKTITALSLLIIISVLVASCIKENAVLNTSSTTASSSITSGIIGKWGLLSDTTKDYITLTNAGSYSGVATDYWDFRTDGKAYVREDIFTDTFPYTILPDNKLLFGEGPGSDTVTILKLTATTAVISIPLPPTSTQYVYLKK